MSKALETIAKNHGFTLVDEKALPEIDGSAFVMRHDASHARLLYLKNADPEKAFSISFKTPAADDTGVFHILEHSVLCGSKKFPVKEPFVNLLKSSMQTFLNAMTFPDKTMYPVASTNERDLLNLMDVYLDAVFRPRIYQDPRIFEQEGWHYELEGEEDAERLVINGVVFNEMKGALSDAESVLYDTLSAALFPDTTYRFESGGTPAGIPELDYDGFLDTHRRHYRPDNSYIVLYGDLDIDRFLGFISEQYLTPLASSTEAPFAVNELALQAPVVVENVQQTMVTTPDSSCTALGYVAGRSSEPVRIMAVSVLVDALLGSNEAPLKRALLDAGIADDIRGYVSDSILQPFVVIQAKGLRAHAAEQLGTIVEQKAKEFVAGTFDETLVEAALSHAEFVMREHDLGYADGVILSMSAMESWLYDDNDPLSYIRYEDLFATLRQKLGTGYFKDLIRELFLENLHRAQAEIVPIEGEEGSAEDQRLAALQARLTPDELRAIADEAAALRQAQATPDAPESLALLPKLTIADIGAPAAVPAVHLTQSGGCERLIHDVDSHGIVYAFRYFDLSRVSFEELPYVSILALVLGRLDTDKHTAAEIDTLAQSKLGAMSFAVEVYESEHDAHTLFPKFVVATSALVQNVSAAASIPYEVITSTRFDDFDKLYDMLLQRKVIMEQMFTMSGNSVAALRASSYCMDAGMVKEQLTGIDFYLFLRALIADFDKRKEALVKKMEELSHRIFVEDGSLLSFTGGEAALAQYDSACGSLAQVSAQDTGRLVVPEWHKAREAFIVPSDVTYTAVCADRRTICDDYDGTWAVATRVLSFDYLWNQVRVIGGAYGVGFSAARTGNAYFYSYRDPHVDETIERFAAAGTWLSAFDPSSDEFTGYVVSAAAAFDKPLRPRGLARRQDAMHITGYTEEERLATREQVIATDLTTLRALGAPIARIVDQGNLCVVGNQAIIEQSRMAQYARDLFAE